MGLKSFFATITSGWEDWRILLAARDDDDDDYNFTSGTRRGADYNFTSGPRRGYELDHDDEEEHDDRSETTRTPSTSS
ncbi:uncharacterized protein BKCO1_6600019 [Diplodia corticola]|uniref:Uncharacterized protein n=1 Tax=Diplodia corticola TaxID=236234 RepID=A0A1J9QMJ7_9PEZI|nr:uncharacterized protein BKCO1_6600019 [Diplodia corticola]OJD30094.1 hypothetical protein BKCO1_6600019 [Diplodia corticola]